MDLYPINWLTVLWAMVAATLLTLAWMNLVLAVRRQGRAAKGHLLFAVLAVSAAGSGVFELLLANTRTIDQYGALLRAAHLPIGLLVLVTPWFVILLFRTGRRWLAIGSNVLWGAGLAMNVVSPHSRVYSTITSIERVPTFGSAEFTWVTGTGPADRGLGYAGVFLALVFVLDAAVSLQKRGQRRGALIVGLCLGTSLAIGLFHSGLVEMGLLRSPYLVSVAFTTIMGGMAFELVHDAVDAPVLEQRVHVQEAEVAHLSRQTMLGEMSGGIAHELSQPLTAILNNAEAAISFLDRELPDLGEVKGALLDISEQDRHACEVVASFARLVKKGKRQSELLDLNSLVAEALTLERGDLANAGIDVATVLSPDIPRVRGDRVLLSLVILNLVRNSAEAMAQTDPSGRKLSVSTEVRDGGVELTVSDRGVGIAEEDRERVFEAFFTTRPEGSGLGLAVGRTLAELHGGRVWSTAGPQGLGTTMHVFLPKSDGTPT